MRLFRRSNKDPEPSAEQWETTEEELDEPAESITATPLDAASRERVAAGLTTLSEIGVDVDDLTSLSEAFDAALDRGDSDLLTTLAIGVGEHLARHGAMRWAIVTDSFGRDLGLEGRRRNLHVIPESLLTARWMRQERGWLAGAVAHLADINTR